MNEAYSYSGGLDHGKVLPALLDRVKWTGEGAASKSGRYFDDGSFHASVSKATLRELQDKAGISDSEFSNFLAGYRKAVVLRSLNQVFSASTIDHKKLLFDLYEPRAVFSAHPSDFCGYEITVAAETDMVTQITGVVARFHESGPVPLYLYRHGDLSPIWEGIADGVAGEFKYTELQHCFLHYSRHRSSKFFFVYKASELGTRFPFIGDEWVENCFSIFDARPVATKLPAYGGATQYLSRPIGLNLEVASFWDHTERVLSFPSQFDQLIGLTGAAMFIETALYSPRMNGDKVKHMENSRFALQMDLAGTLPITDSPHTEGLRDLMKKEAAQIRSSLLKKPLRQAL